MTLNLDKAAFVQQKLASRLVLERGVRRPTRIAGADFSYHKKMNLIGTVLVVFKFPELEIIEAAQDIRDVRVPYISGYLSLREGPSFLRTFMKLKNRPDLTLIDGNGIAHPRKMGLASYVGVILDIPTIGCAKSPVFAFDPPDAERSAYSHYKNQKNELVGYCLRT
jgi:deoxyribonuclease V